MPHLKAEDVTIWYEQFGTGPDILWIPGGDQPGSDWHEFQVPHFTKQYRNTTYDPRGIGQTAAPPSSNWTIEAHAADAAAIIRAVCEPPVSVVGLSMGSLIVQELCLSYPELIRCGIAMGTAAKAEGYLAEWMTAEVDFRRGGGTLPEDFAITHYGVFMYPSEVIGDPELWDKVRPFVAGAYGTRTGDELAAQWQGCIDYDSVPRLPGCQVPLHVVGFSQDVQSPPAWGRRVAELAPRGRFHLLEGLGHCSAFGHRPDAVNACIAEILETAAP